MDGMYDADVLEWSERQARLLRGTASGEPADEAPDWGNIIEEVESAGREQLHAVESFLVQALAHAVKAEAWPLSREVPGWRAEARGFRGEAAARLAPSMRTRLDLGRIYARAIRLLPDTIDGQPLLPVPAACPTTLDALSAE